VLNEHRWYSVDDMATNRGVSIECVRSQLWKHKHNNPKLYHQLVKKIWGRLHIRDDFYYLMSGGYERGEIERIYYKYIDEFGNDLAFAKDIMAVVEYDGALFNIYQAIHNLNNRNSYQKVYKVMKEYEQKKSSMV